MADGEIEVSPMERISKPIDRPDQLNPFTKDQLLRLLAATKKTRHPKRDEAILLLMLDTGIRVSELCTLTVVQNAHGRVSLTASFYLRSTTNHTY